MRSGQRLTGICLTCLAAILALASCARDSTSVSASHTPTTSGAGAFVCANPPGSDERYAYVAKGGPMYLAQGCSTPVAVRAPAGRLYTPIAFSPTGVRLLAWDNQANPQAPDTQQCLALVEVSSGAVTPTKLCSPYGTGFPPQWYSPIGWASDDSFYLASTVWDASSSESSVTVFFVSLPQLTRSVVTKLTWVASVANANAPSGIAMRGDALFYGGYVSRSEGGAWLHRFSLITETDTRIVRLGLAGIGGCQVSEAPCAWTGPWDVSRDGSKIAYHNPGPTQSLSDTVTDTTETDTLLYLAGSDGSGAVRLFPQVALTGGFNQPSFSPDGRYVAAKFASASFRLPGKAIFERLRDGALTTAPSELQFQSWTPQPGVALMSNTTTGGAPDYILHLELYNVATGARAPLQPGTYSYVWA